MRFDAPTYARAWLAVAQASATRDDVAALSRTIALEEFPYGIRLVATDRYTLLTSWVPNLDVPLTRQRIPGLDEVPDRTVVAHDADGRGRSLLGYILKIARRDKLDAQPDGVLELVVEFDVRIPAGENADQPLEGLEPRYVTLSVPDVERVYLDVVEARYPAWRGLLIDHHAQDTKAIALSPDVVTRVAGASKWAEGPLVVTFGGTDRVAHVEFPEADPSLEGLMMPRRWVLEGEDPRAADTPVPGVDPDEEDADAEVCPTCDGPGVCLRHASGLVTTANALGSSLREGESFQLSPGVSVEVTGTGPLAEGLAASLREHRELLTRAVEVVTGTQFGSARMLATRLSIGQDRARTLLDELEANGIVGPATHGRSRAVLARAEDLTDVLRQMGLLNE